MNVALVQELLDRGNTYSQISDELKRRFPSSFRGLSERSVRRFVTQNCMRAISKRNKEEALERAISEVRMFPNTDVFVWAVGHLGNNVHVHNYSTMTFPHCCRLVLHMDDECSKAV